SLDALHVLDLVDLADREYRRLTVGRTDLDALAEILHTSVDQRVEVLRQCAHRREREDADEDAEDRQRAAQLVAEDISDDFQGGLSIGAGRLNAGKGSPAIRLREQFLQSACVTHPAVAMVDALLLARKT